MVTTPKMCNTQKVDKDRHTRTCSRWVQTDRAGGNLMAEQPLRNLREYCVTFVQGEDNNKISQ